MADFSVTTEDHAESYWKTARVLRVVGWTCIVWGCMISIYIWTGLKAGSTVWLVWTMGQFFAGAVCLALFSLVPSFGRHRVPESGAPGRGTKGGVIFRSSPCAE